MNDTATQGGEILQIIFMLIWCIPISIVSYKLGKEKGRNAKWWAVGGFIPGLNFILLAYFVGTPINKKE